MLPPQLAPHPHQPHSQAVSQHNAAQHAAAQQGWAPQPPQPFPPPQTPRGPDPLARPPQPAQATPPAYVPQPRQPDPAAYDLGNYGVPPTMPSARQQPAPHPQHAPPQWQHEPSPAYAPQQMPPQSGGYAQPQMAPPPQPQFGQPQFSQPHLAPHPQAQPHPLAQQAQQGPQQAPEQTEEYEYEDEPPRRRRRWLVMVALIGSIGVGGGMAYAYKHFFGPKPVDRNQVVRAQPGPVKSAPADRGGKQMANTGSASLNNRLPSEGASSAPGGETDSNGVRKVATVPVDTSRASGSGVPGMQIVANPGGFPSPGQINGGPPAASPPPQRQAAVPVQQVAPPPPPAAQPPARPPPARAQPAEPVEAAPPPPRRPPVVKEAAVTPAAERPKPTGHVAVLGYRRTQLDAMKAMADVQQRYDVLRDKKLEIIQSDETARGLGVIYRIVVGPRGSVASARELCGQLKQAGMPESSCYTMAQ